MSRIGSYPRWPARVGSRFGGAQVATLALLLGAVSLAAIAADPARSMQADDDVLYACYVPASGTMYRIRTGSGPNDCRDGHVEFSWNAAGPAGSPGISGLHRVYSGDVRVEPGEIGRADVSCPSNEVAITGGWLLGAHDPADPVPAVRGSFGLPAPETTPPTSWRVSIYNNGAGYFEFQSVVTCAVVGT